MGEMSWIAGWFSLLSIVVPIPIYARWHSAGVATLVVMVPLTVVMIIWFQIGNFWPWLLLYLFLCWLACWATGEVSRLRRGHRDANGHSV